MRFQLFAKNEPGHERKPSCSDVKMKYPDTFVSAQTESAKCTDSGEFLALTADPNNSLQTLKTCEALSSQTLCLCWKN